MNERYIKAYTSSVTASEMFKAISLVPLHQAFGGHDPIERLQTISVYLTDEDAAELKKAKTAREVLILSCHMGQKTASELANALEKDGLAELSMDEIIQKYVLSLVFLLPDEQRKTIGKFLANMKDMNATEIR